MFAESTGAPTLSYPLLINLINLNDSDLRLG